MTDHTQLYTLDPTGSDVYGEAAALRERGDATRVEFCGISGWAITSYSLLASVLQIRVYRETPDRRMCSVRCGFAQWL